MFGLGPITDDDAFLLNGTDISVTRKGPIATSLPEPRFLLVFSALDFYRRIDFCLILPIRVD